jgi:hypothetical protein
MKKAIVATILGVLTLTAAAYAGVALKSQSKILAPYPTNSNTTLYLDNGKLRVESTSSQGEKEIMIFRKDKGLFWVIDPQKGTYTEITREQLRQMRHQMDEYKRQMEAAMKNMPPEQRAMMEQMMKSQMPAEPQTPKISYRKMGSGRVGRWYCTEYQGFSNGAKVEEVWVTPFSTLGISPSDLDVLKEMGDFFNEFYKGSGNSLVGDTKKWEKVFKGFPVKTKAYENGKVVYEDTVVEVKRTSLPITLFEVPKGLKQETLIPRGR